MDRNNLKMGTVQVTGKVKKANITARVYRANTDSWEELGIIASTSRIEMARENFKNFIKKIKAKWLR